MSFADRLHRLVPDLSASLARFPVPALLSVLLCVYANLDVATLVSNGTVSDNQVYLGGAAAFMAAGAAHYFAQGRGLSRLTELLLALVVAIVAGALAFWDVYLRSSHLFLFAGLLPLLMIAGFLRSDAKQGALWLFNLRLGLAVVLAVIVGLIFAGGISAILASLEFLFNVDLPWRAHEHVWATAASLIAPLYGLSLMPVRLDEEVALSGGRDTLIERGVSVLVNYIMVPIAVVYTLILHAYAVKILLDGALPKGQIGLMVSIFAVGGTATWLIAWPWRETGTVLLRLFMRYWFWFTIVPVILLVIAIWERISTYGVTPDRYGIALIAVWLALVTLYLAIRRNRADMRALLGSFAILVLIGSAGPWGANNLSIESQFGRLVGYFQSEKLLTPENKIVDQPPTISPDGKREIETILWTLSSMGGLDKLKPYFAGRKDDPFADQMDRWGALGNIRKILGLDIYTPATDQVSFGAGAPFIRDISGQGRLVGPIQVTMNAADRPDQVWAKTNGQTLEIMVGAQTWSLPVKPLMEKVKAETTSQPQLAQQKPVIYEAEPGLTLVIINASGEIGDKPGYVNLGFWLILK
ncbi:DUF4153 domain-containing protein [Taklimakanibacter albus]|uniref:DUF4153 domain-containing protein n=1 Tax=Taklimakanibacter albus TaxID=2800327 RepID=A0ACC5R248_9HYPH|nr:DUF4153 domain-containing protein [Aestuariivirga sp. YIM B02566]MBK1866692.1 DUF4153 domain-containing protein [Aestuariivirga sp. YIM B02566]